MRRQSFSIALAIAVGSLCLAPVQAHDCANMKQMEMGQPLSGASLYNLASHWTDQDGKPVDLKTLRGQPVVVVMAYTSCKGICPMIVANMQAIEQAAKAKALGKVRYAFFSLDSKVDTPERLRTYAAEHGLDAADWSLYHGDVKAVRDLAAALGIRYRPDGHGGFDHAAVITLLDDKGEIAFQKLDAKLDTDEFVTKIEGLAPSHK